MPQTVRENDSVVIETKVGARNAELISREDYGVVPPIDDGGSKRTIDFGQCAEAVPSIKIGEERRTGSAFSSV
jgi:hypothetical protein